MKFLDIIKKYNAELVRENRRLAVKYSTLLNEAGNKTLDINDIDEEEMLNIGDDITEDTRSCNEEAEKGARTYRSSRRSDSEQIIEAELVDTINNDDELPPFEEAKIDATCDEGTLDDAYNAMKSVDESYIDNDEYREQHGNKDDVTELSVSEKIEHDINNAFHDMDDADITHYVRITDDNGRLSLEALYDVKDGMSGSAANDKSGVWTVDDWALVEDILNDQNYTLGIDVNKCPASNIVELQQLNAINENEIVDEDISIDNDPAFIKVEPV